MPSIQNVAIAISTSVYDHIDGVGKVGGIVGAFVVVICALRFTVCNFSGAAVSGSFLFIVGLANSIILWRVLAKRRRVRVCAARSPSETDVDCNTIDQEGACQTYCTGRGSSRHRR